MAKNNRRPQTPKPKTHGQEKTFKSETRIKDCTGYKRSVKHRNRGFSESF